RRTAARQERRTGGHAVVAPDDVRRQLWVERMRRRPLVDQEELRVGRDGARSGDVERRGSVHVYAVGRIGKGRKRINWTRQGRNRQLHDERRGAWARRQRVCEGPPSG